MGNSKVCSPAHADDIVLTVNKEEELKATMKRLEHFLDRRKLNLNAEVQDNGLQKESGKENNTNCKWKGERVEEVKEMSYLRLKMQRNGNLTNGVKERLKRVNVVKQIWGIGERKFQDDFKRRMTPFDSLVVGVVSYRVELFNWKERIECERILQKCIRWCLGSRGEKE